MRHTNDWELLSNAGMSFPSFAPLMTHSNSFTLSCSVLAAADYHSQLTCAE